MDPSGRADDFVKEGQDGLFAAQALAVDVARRALYVSSEAQPLMRGYRKEDEGQSFVFEFDLDNGRFRRRLAPPGPRGHASDLAVGPDGALYVADPYKGAVYRLRPGGETLEVLVPEGALASAQGMAVSADGALLFVADYSGGIARVDLPSGSVAFLEAPERLLVTGIDGLVLAGDSLLAIQNGIEPHRLLRLRLDPGRSRIVDGEVLVRAHPQWDEPTLGVRVGADFYYVANSQYGAFAEDGTVDETRLKEPAILRLRLPWVAER
jgi:sugar lactone lactonase YvrE